MRERDKPISPDEWSQGVLEGFQEHIGIPLEQNAVTAEEAQPPKTGERWLEFKRSLGGGYLYREVRTVPNQAGRWRRLAQADHEPETPEGKLVLTSEQLLGVIDGDKLRRLRDERLKELSANLGPRGRRATELFSRGINCLLVQIEHGHPESIISPYECWQVGYNVNKAYRQLARLALIWFVMGIPNLDQPQDFFKVNVGTGKINSIEKATYGQASRLIRSYLEVAEDKDLISNIHRQFKTASEILFESLRPV